MRAAIVGGGLTGLFTAMMLARRGHDVVVFDRDAGPPGDGETWQRVGVMQFHLPHTFRHQVIDALAVELPDVLAAVIAAGAEVAGGPDPADRPAVLRCRRSLLEWVLRVHAAAEPGVTLVSGHVDEILTERGCAVGVRLGSRYVRADLVLDASGRASRLTDGIRPLPEGAPCGAVYLSRQYELQPGAPPGPTNSVLGLALSYPGYWAIAFLHDNRAFSIALVHDGTDRRLRELRHVDVFDAAVSAIPHLCEWVDPRRSVPLTPVQVGGRLENTYRGQLDGSGRPALPGLISVGDAVCTTTPLAGRGVALAFLQARGLVRQLDDHRHDLHSATMGFDQWCATNIKPWFIDHVHCDSERQLRWAGADIDPSRPLPSDLIVAAAEADPRLQPIVGPYLAMEALPASLTAARPLAQEVYRRGWRPPVPPGPSKQELAELCAHRSSASSREIPLIRGFPEAFASAREEKVTH
ncbi:flavin-dependent dehydrogenase [Mycobacterium sp. BK086]|uniref:FAD-dependent oxidoreductase n=1 Tax=Mycobacterium sp. BK086 TaxID=2512165 RepID=UPI00105B3B0C|nr:FAD-dependent oxidoreductase [Mycobacterium sp. BK086]TDO17820.1 flavin-dependent dehydrogenase [Mycobacterium sp. BK086]